MTLADCNSLAGTGWLGDPLAGQVAQSMIASRWLASEIRLVIAASRAMPGVRWLSAMLVGRCCLKLWVSASGLVLRLCFGLAACFTALALRGFPGFAYGLPYGFGRGAGGKSKTPRHRPKPGERNPAYKKERK